MSSTSQSNLVIRRDGRFTTSKSERLNATSSGVTTVGVKDVTSVVTSGSWDIAFEDVPALSVGGWVGATVFLSSARYIAVAGVQQLQVTGYVTMTSTEDPGQIAFTTPFRTPGAILFGGQSTCSDNAITMVIPSVCNCLNSTVLINIFPPPGTTRVNFVASVMADIIPGISSGPI